MLGGAGREARLAGDDDPAVVRELAIGDGRRVLRAVNPGWAEIELARDNETLILGTAVLGGEAVCRGRAPPCMERPRHYRMCCTRCRPCARRGTCAAAIR